MSTNDDAYGRLSAYFSDLTHRLGLLEEWKERHPDHLSPQFRDDEKRWEEYVLRKEFYESEIGQKTIDPVVNPLGPFISSFNPEDQKPHTADLLTVQRFSDLMQVALEARALAQTLTDTQKGLLA